MTTHLRARALQAGALVALVSGMLVVAASPAQAARPTVEITNVSSTNIATGEKTTLKYRVTNNNQGPTTVRIQVSGMSCANDCSPAINLPPGNGGAREFTATLTAPQVDPGDSESVEVQVSATVNNNETGTATETIQVRGPDKPQTVRQISGRVRDLNGKAISGAQVFMQDSADHKYETTSNNSGAYSFTSSDDKPIAPGQVSIGAGKEGFKAAAISVNAAAGKSVSAPSLNLTPTAAAPSATPSATEGASAPPVDDATETTDPGETAAATDPASNDSGSGSMLFIILGGLLVAAGVGAIVLVLMRRKGNDDDDLADGPGGGIPPSQGGGRYGDATRVAAPVGARPNDATMVAGMSGASSISDAPTMLQRPVPADDEFPDPYGAPAQMAHGGYSAAAAGAYGAGAQVPVQGGYDDAYAGPATQYGRPVQPPEEQYEGFIPASADQRYDEQTGMYRPEPAYEQSAGYDAGGYRQEPTGTGGYPGGAHGQAQQGGYGQQPDPGYGSWDAPAVGADGGNAYGPASGAGAYGGRAQASGGGAYGGRAQASGGGAYGGRGQASGGGAYGGGAPAPGSAGAYGAPGGSGTYGAAPRGYEVPAQRSGTYSGGAPSYGDQAGGYGDQHGAGYGGDQGGYDPRAIYGRPDGYEQAPGRGAQQGAYGAPAGYDQGGYEQGGYDQGGYDQQGGGRHGGQARPEPTPPGQRRPVDWLDD